MLISVLSTQSFASGVELQYLFPVGTAGPLAKIMTEIVKDFNKEHPNIKVVPIYSGSYWDTMEKAMTSALGGNPPDVAVFCNVHTRTAVDANIVIPIDKFIEKRGGEAYLSQFFPAFLLNCQIDGKTFAIPYQRSTPIFYWNKDLFRERGLDPNTPPENWSDLVDYAQRLTKRDAAGNIVHYGLHLVPDYWIFGCFVLQNGGKLDSDTGDEVYFDNPETIEVLKLWVDLARKRKVVPIHTDYGAMAADFAKGVTAMMYHSTGSLTFVRERANFSFDVAFQPKGKQYGVYTGGGNLFIFNNIPEERQEAAWKFIQWMSSLETSARWCRQTGYLAVTPAAWELPSMKEFAKRVPQSKVALAQLKFAQRELMPHNFPQIKDIINTAIENALAGSLTPEEALAGAQKEADEILEAYR